jgi:hypothetical protein
MLRQQASSFFRSVKHTKVAGSREFDTASFRPDLAQDRSSLSKRGEFMLAKHVQLSRRGKSQRSGILGLARQRRDAKPRVSQFQPSMPINHRCQASPKQGIGMSKSGGRASHPEFSHPRP